MKKSKVLVICMAVLCCIFGCGKSDAKPAGSSTAATASSSVATASSSVAEVPNAAPTKSAEGIDVDLTALSSTMVYAEVYNMMTAPVNYVGKTVKMDGIFAYYKDENTKKEYFACIVQDATACCSQGIEFVLSGSHKYPEDYPKLNSNICVVGEFDTYKEGESSYCTLRNAKFIDANKKGPQS